MDRNQAHVVKKSHLKIDQSGGRVIRKLQAESGLSKQLLGNFQTENSCDHNYSRLK